MKIYRVSTWQPLSGIVISTHRTAWQTHGRNECLLCICIYVIRIGIHIYPILFFIMRTHAMCFETLSVHFVSHNNDENVRETENRKRNKNEETEENNHKSVNDMPSYVSHFVDAEQIALIKLL